MVGSHVASSAESTSPTRSGVLAAIGATPLVELSRMGQELGLRLFAKLERNNPGGSIKDRAAVNMIHDRMRHGVLQPGRSHVIESSSGNLGIGLAQVCRYHRIHFTCVVDINATALNRAVLAALGATLEVVTSPDPLTGEFLPARLRRVRELLAVEPTAYWPNQYANPLNAAAQEQTMREIVQAVGIPDYVVCATGSCGTLRGCASYVHRHQLRTALIAVDAVGSAIFGDPTPAVRHLPGHGAAQRPALFRSDDADKVVHVSDMECVQACLRLTEAEAILAGGSSGATMAALYRLRAELPADALCVAIFPDGGERYLDTIYSPAWVAEHLGEPDFRW